MEEAAGAEGSGHIEVRVSIVVVVPRAGAHSVDPVFQPGFPGHVTESAVALVPVERGESGTGADGTRQRTGVDQEDVHPAVAVVIEEDAAGAHRLRQVELACGAVYVAEADPGLRGHVGERDMIRSRVRASRSRARATRSGTSRQPGSTGDGEQHDQRAEGGKSKAATRINLSPHAFLGPPSPVGLRIGSRWPPR